MNIENVFMEIQNNLKDDFRYKNNFDLLRFLAAVLVIFGHSFHLLHRYTEEPLTMATGSLYFGNIGVYIFFVVSGYLVLSSWERNPNFKNFFKNRILRIVPALVIVVVATVFLLGSIVTTLDLKHYLLNTETWKYLETITIFRIQYSLPGVFEQNIFSSTVNGSLWTLPVEFSLYILLFIMGILGFYKKRITILLLLLFSLFFYIVYQKSLIPSHNDIVVLGIFFIAGMVYFLYKDKIFYDVKILLILLFIWILSFNSTYLIPTSLVFISYFVMYFAFISNKRLNSFGKFGDFSYGMYILAFPIQQTIILFSGNTIRPLELFFSTLLVVLPLAILSWYLIESPALQLKKKYLL